MKIGIIIINWNGGKDTCECLSSLSKIETPKDTSINVLVVDNHSTDDSVEIIKEFIKSINDEGNKAHTIVFSLRALSENRGFSGGNNVGIQRMVAESVDYLMLLNNDVVVHKNFLKHILSQITPGMIVGPKIYFAPGYEYHKSRYQQTEKGKVIWYAGGVIDWDNMFCSHRGVDEVDHGQYNTREETEFISGCCMVFHKNVIEIIGLLDDKYFLYYEDVDFCLRAKKKGIKLMYEPASFIWHKNAQSSGESGSSLHEYYQTRNRLLFGLKYAPIRSKIALLRESVRFLISGGIKSRAVADFYKGKYGRKT